MKKVELPIVSKVKATFWCRDACSEQSRTMGKKKWKKVILPKETGDSVGFKYRSVWI